MAKYTAGAYAGVRPITEDFGEIAQQTADRNLRIQMQIGAMELQQRKEREREIKAERDNFLNDLREAEELGRKALGYQPANFSEEMRNTLISNAYNKVSALKRELRTASPERRIQINSELATLAKNTTDFNTDMKAFQDLLGKIPEMMDKEGGWSSLTAMPIIKDLNRAIIGAGEGVKSNGDGTYSVGPYVKFSIGKGGEGIFDLDIYGQKIAGTLPAMGTKVMGMLMKNPYVDTEKSFWQTAGKGIQVPRSQEERVLSNGAVGMLDVPDLESFKDAVGKDFDNRYKRYDTIPFSDWPDSVLKSVVMEAELDDDIDRSGQEYVLDAIRREYIDRAVANAGDKTQIKMAPSQFSAYRYAADQQKDYALVLDAARSIQNFMTGSSNDDQFVGKHVTLSVDEDVKPGTTVIKGASKEGDILTIDVAGIVDSSGGETVFSDPTPHKYDLSKPADVEKLVPVLLPAYNEGKPAAQKVDPAALTAMLNFNVAPVDKSVKKRVDPNSEIGKGIATTTDYINKIRSYEDPQKNPQKTEEQIKTEKDIEEKTGVSLSKAENGKNLAPNEAKALISGLNEELKKGGYDIEISGGRGSFYDNDMTISVKDKDGKTFKKFSNPDSSTAIEELLEFASVYFGTVDPGIKNEQFIRSAPGTGSSSYAGKFSPRAENKFLGK
jgi:hypothetical protein